MDGRWDRAFTPVREAFAACLDDDELGAAVCVSVDGAVMVDLWGGETAAGTPWQHDTVVNVFSATKGVVATIAHELGLDLDTKVESYWPEYAARGKGDTTVRDLLSHRAGLPALRQEQPPGSLYDWDHLATALANEEPWWEPGTKHGYHAVTYGFLVGEVLRRATGKTVRQLTEELALDVHIGLPEAERSRLSGVVFGPPPKLAALTDPNSVTAKAFGNPPDLATVDLTGARWLDAEVPAANGHATARGLAELYARTITKSFVRQAIAPVSDGPDEVLLGHSRFASGYMLPSPMRPFSPGANAFGHPGAGGALAFGDPDAGLAFGYTPNKLRTTVSGSDPRWDRLVGAVYSCLS
ncbi:beta-lactamase family protein [Allokutzneria sp. A3M-2-11 16]|uniref:serine hydrolase domain-containing protein n=1 Tax=Allokutzneria sp. A3M-2-11 16 TaxID=2962043 RepID=UPI0020B89F90|nr:serine hydrolase domain-containing protein [Allokutzneria sp. A3M-2-11 16]MCP3802427.1 beta-lactamase family protein [Allokutzneria sp. A3M-2-11 16]